MASCFSFGAIGERIENAFTHAYAHPDIFISEEVLKTNVSDVPAILALSCMVPSLPGL